MRSAARPALLACALLTTMVAVGCATKRFQPSPFNPDTKATIPNYTTIDFAVTNGVCVKTGPYAMIGFNGNPVTWRVTNTCKEPVVVNIERFRVKHRVFHLFPFEQPIPETTVPPMQTGDKPVPITATVLKAVNEESMKGFQVYKYIVRFRVGSGKDNADDPEIILDWP